MSDDNQTADDSRRDFMKGAAATGLSVAGLTAFSGNAAAQNKKTVAEITNAQELVQNGSQFGSGLLVVQVQNVNVSDVLDAAVAVGGDVVDVTVQNVLNNNTVVLNVTDTVDIIGNTVQVAVTLLGTTTQDATNMFAVGDTDTLRL